VIAAFDAFIERYAPKYARSPPVWRKIANALCSPFTISHGIIARSALSILTRFLVI
jgi:hypothetical protein